MYKRQKQLVPSVTSYLGVYSIRSRLSQSYKSPQILEQTFTTPQLAESVVADEDPFPNSTRPYCKRLETIAHIQACVVGNISFFAPLNSTCVSKNSSLLADRIVGAEQNNEPKRYSGFIVHVQHVFAMVKRYILIKVRDVNRLANLTYFPLADIVVAGLVSFWMARNNVNAIQEQIIYLLELACWIIINATHVESCFNFIEEIQTRNLVNLFSSSLNHFEWVIASLILSSFEAVAMSGVCGLFLYCFYEINIFTTLGLFFPLFLALMIMSGWVMATVTISLMMKFGLRMTILTLALPYMIMSLSAAFYPLAVLPGWLQGFASLLPTTYIFEGLRTLVIDQIVPTQDIIISLVLNIFYIILALFFYNFMFKKSMEQGLARLETE